MKTSPLSCDRAIGTAFGLVVVAALNLGAAAAAPAQPEFTPPKSVFVWNQSDPAFGRDPFFPNSPDRSGRWAPRKVVPVAAVNTVKPVVDPVKPVVDPVKPVVDPVKPVVEKPVEYPLILTGIGGGRSAIINNITFLKGERVKVNTALGQVVVRLDEVKENAVVVTVIAGGKETQQTVPMVGN